MDGGREWVVWVRGRGERERGHNRPPLSHVARGGSGRGRFYVAASLQVNDTLVRPLVLTRSALPIPSPPISPGRRAPRRCTAIHCTATRAAHDAALQPTCAVHMCVLVVHRATRCAAGCANAYTHVRRAAHMHVHAPTCRLCTHGRAGHAGFPRMHPRAATCATCTQRVALSPGQVRPRAPPRNVRPQLVALSRNAR